MRILAIILIFSLLLTNILTAQVSISMDNSTPDASAMLDVQSTTKGMLIPRLTTAQRSGIASPATGLMVFDSDTASFWFYNGSSWTELISDPNDGDSDPTNEIITSATLTGSSLSIVEGGNATNVDLSSLADGTGTDDQSLSLIHI